ncbi:hypothetical protein Val02_48200 [Virgisporangium aliadipatigenens]|uniref:Histidine kinase/HSP90-like ATPase domain-containing protein n=1 Tax=Virgisporangium aliadipatigenens TaxID=741659 RepID=A0A8J4DRR0_9ACTN|nr:ATP-binding protein [Virgisporangium aliadipatigenens]GIJ47934.1 hypothetical protein Val02_48200 [Virgisporangium aliadipatigenens]
MDDNAVRLLLHETVEFGDLSDLRTRLLRLTAAAGLAPERGQDFAVAVHEAAANAVRHGGGRGEVVVTRDGDRRLTAEISDHGPGLPSGVAAALPDPEATGGRGLWMADALTEHLRVDTCRRGTTVRFDMTLDPP